MAKVEKVVDECQEAMKSMEARLEAKIIESFEEKADIESRKLKVMCFGLPENNQTKDDEKDLAAIVSTEFGIDEDKYRQPIRIGKYDKDKCRPVKFTVENVATKQAILRAGREKAKNIPRGQGGPRVYFHADLTTKQRQEAFEKRRERRRREDEFELQRAARATGDLQSGQAMIVGASQHRVNSDENLDSLLNSQ